MIDDMDRLITAILIELELMMYDLMGRNWDDTSRGDEGAEPGTQWQALQWGVLI